MLHETVLSNNYSRQKTASRQRVERFSQAVLAGKNQFVGCIGKRKIHHDAGKQKHAQHPHENAAIGDGDVRNLKCGFSLLRHCLELVGRFQWLQTTTILVAPG